MPKSVKNIIDVSEGINSDANSNVISERSVADALNVSLDRVGKIKSSAGFDILGTLNVNNYESGLYNFRTEDDDDSPKEYLLSEFDGSVTVKNAITGATVSTFPSWNPSGMLYSNGILFVYPKTTGNIKVFKAGVGYSNLDSYILDYDNNKPTCSVYIGTSIVAGSSSNDVKLTIDKSETDAAITTVKSSGTFDWTPAPTNSGSTEFHLYYKDIDYVLGWISFSTDGETVGNLLHNKINNHPTIPLTSEWDNETAVMTLRSLLQGSEGDGDITIYVDLDSNDEPGGSDDLYAEFGLSGGRNDFLDNPENTERILQPGKYHFSASYVMWDGSETNIEGVSQQFEVTTRLVASFNLEIVNTTVFNDFVVGVKCYIDSEVIEYSLLAEYRHDYNERWKFYNEDEFLINNTNSGEHDIVFPLRRQFTFEAGYDVGELASPNMKKFIIVNNRGYAFNVGYNGTWYQDRIIVSPQNKPFLLPENNKIDIVTEDGDEYVTAEHFGSFIFCFKSLTLFILNISSSDPASFFLSDSIYGVGVNSGKAVAKSEVGIFWANKNGLYFHNGEGLQDISLNKVEDQWKAIASNDIIVGYDKINKKAVFIRGDITFSFDIRTNAFTRYNTVGIDSSPRENKSNMVVSNDNLIISVGNDQYVFEPNLSSNVQWELVTKDFDLGGRSVRKKVRRFYVTFSETITPADFHLYYKLDGGTSFIELTNKSYINNDDDLTKDTILRFDLPRSITAYTIQLKIISTVSAVIRDISIIYRNKLPK